METCFACGKPIEEREMPRAWNTSDANVFLGVKMVGKYTIRRQAWDENWKEIHEDTFFHEECYYKGFVMAVKHGYLTHAQHEAYKNLYQGAESFRSDGGVDHT